MLVWRFAGSILLVWSLLDYQATQTSLASCKLPQPLVDLIEVAAAPSILCCVCTTCRDEFLFLLYLVGDSCSWVTVQQAGEQGDSAHHVLCKRHILWRITHILVVETWYQGVHNAWPQQHLPWVLGCNFSYSIVLKKTRLYLTSSGPVLWLTVLGILRPLGSRSQLKKAAAVQPNSLPRQHHSNSLQCCKGMEDSRRNNKHSVLHKSSTTASVMVCTCSTYMVHPWYVLVSTSMYTVCS